MIRKLMATAISLALGAGTASATDLNEMSWDEIVALAQEQGELTWYVWYLQDELRGAVSAFEEKYGITVTIPETTNSGQKDKLRAERDRETGDMDVFATSFNTASELDLSDFFYDLDELLPDTEGRAQEIGGISGEGYLFGFWGNQTGIAYDPAHVSVGDLPQSPEEFAAFWAANPGKMGFNYEKGGSGPSFITNTLRVLSDIDFYNPESSPEKIASLQGGIDFFNEHAANYVITASNADSITRISDAELWMAPAWEDHLAGLQKRGEARSDIAYYIPSMGMSGGGNGVAIPLNAPNAAAALVFVNWLTSAETQTALNVSFGTAPTHADADGSKALVPAEQRVYQTGWASKPFYSDMLAHFVEEVVLER
ncbi:extracellular solute-binding protein [Roseibium sp. TrichSKD4]|uniref:extracellular solute-binding protein n=1 Tax=Roseibium sp. TrichSKD4 TaxID=744980 RepID=UPI0001E57193|nr:extracellular solute-binding protein [Roseibium sp. TrichSKD4]EFO28727.1 extracellular solute-binding protein [Roseibium sp. TrichSKD4]